MEYKFGSLFAGVGGICLGFERVKKDANCFKQLWSNEIDKNASKTYENNFNNNHLKGDFNDIVNGLNPQHLHFMLKEKLSVLTGGFPCQPFSISGKRLGFSDLRGNCFYNIIKLIKEMGKAKGKPRVVFLENVKNLKSHDGGNTFKTIKLELESLGYIFKSTILNTNDYTNIPQNRERIFIVCFLNQSDADNFTMFDRLSDFKIIKTNKTRINDIHNCLDLSINIKDNYDYYYTKEKYPNYFKEDKKNPNSVINLTIQITDENEFYQLRRGMYVRQNKKGICPTLTANMGTGGHNVPLIKVCDGIRKLTPSETFRLQGFPISKGYRFVKGMAKGHLYKQAGNAVTIDLVSLIALEILNAFVAV